MLPFYRRSLRKIKTHITQEDHNALFSYEQQSGGEPVTWHALSLPLPLINRPSFLLPLFRSSKFQSLYFLLLSTLPHSHFLFFVYLFACFHCVCLSLNTPPFLLSLSWSYGFLYFLSVPPLQLPSFLSLVFSFPLPTSSFLFSSSFVWYSVFPIFPPSLNLSRLFSAFCSSFT